MKRSLLPVLPLLLFSLAAVLSATEPVPIILKPDVAPKSLHINYIQEVGSCTYKVTIATSCFSPLFTTDEIGILFGDSHGNQIIELNLDNGEKAFDSCKTDTFDLKNRPCSDEISYMYINKNGADNWLPDSVEISGGSDIKPLLFIFNSSIPRNVWYGFDLRHFPSPPSSDPPPFVPWSSSPPPPSHHLPPPPEPILPPPEPILPPPPPPIPPSSSSKVSGQKWVVYAILGLMTIADVLL